MAVMWPRKLPYEITSSVLRSTECKVYNRLSEVLDDTFVVYYSRPWLGISPNGEEIDGECDFVIAHPRYGLLTLEVKGGAVSYNPETESWSTRDRWGYNHKIKNPVHQARDSKYQIINKIRKAQEGLLIRFRAHHGVIFPDSLKPERISSGAYIPDNIICYLDDFEQRFKNWILDRMGAFRVSESGDEGLGEDGMRVTEAVLADPIRLHFPLGKKVSDDLNEIAVLTQQQYQILNLIKYVPRVKISGGAGTGKTVLAVEEALRLSNQGKKVLLTCYNRPLAQYMKRILPSGRNILIATFHDICHRYALSEKLSIPEISGKGELFATIYPELLKKAVTRNEDLRFDAIIIDEGQDFLQGWIEALNLALKPSDSSLMRFFYDNNQTVYNNTAIPDDMTVIPISLNINIRNTKKICELINCYYSGSDLVPSGPYGQEPEFIIIEEKGDLSSAVHSVLNRIIDEDNVLPSDIAILTDSKEYFNEIAPGDRCSNISCYRCDRAEPDGIILDTVRRFKGLESPVVISVLSNNLLLDKELMYVALSRPRSVIIIAGTTRQVKSLKKTIKHKLTE